jgi:hypothetical protein
VYLHIKAVYQYVLPTVIVTTTIYAPRITAIISETTAFTLKFPVNLGINVTLIQEYASRLSVPLTRIAIPAMLVTFPPCLYHVLC